MKVLKAKSVKYLFCPHLPGIGITWRDERIKKAYGLATCRTSRGRAVITWGLNHAEADFIPGVQYVYMGDCWDSRTDEKRKNHEAVITFIG